jgi:hypothetical protein
MVKRLSMQERTVIPFTHHCMYENNLNLFQMFYNLLLDALMPFPFNQLSMSFYVGSGELTLDGHSCPAGCDPSNRLTKHD